MDAAGSERAVVFGSWETGIAAMLLAATYPERTAGLVLVDPFVTYVATDDTPWMFTEERWQQINSAVRLTWGRPDLASDAYRDGPEYRDWYLPWCRASASPGSLVAETDAFSRADARSVLPSIHVPTLVVGYSDDELIARNARFITERISHARLIEPPTEGGEGWHHWYTRAPAILEAVGELIEQVRDEQASFDRVLATVLFTDIVDSTATAATLGDARWKALIEEHDRIARGIIARFRGTYVRGTGDGLLATFDGPARGVRCAEALVDAVKPLGIELRAGLHTGEVELGGHDLAGVGVHIGARVGALAGTSEVWVSSTVKDLVVGSGLTFEDAGEHELKGVPDTWRLYRVVG
jgi:class 3 adenylate cyclase